MCLGPLRNTLFNYSPRFCYFTSCDSEAGVIYTPRVCLCVCVYVSNYGFDDTYCGRSYHKGSFEYFAVTQSCKCQLRNFVGVWLRSAQWFALKISLIHPDIM